MCMYMWKDGMSTVNCLCQFGHLSVSTSHLSLVLECFTNHLLSHLMVQKLHLAAYNTPADLLLAFSLYRM